MQVVSPVPEPAASSHISAGGLEPASCLPADLANTTQKDLAVLEHGMIWTGVTQFRLYHNIEYAHYTLQCMLVGCMGASFNAAQVLVGNSFWVTEGPATLVLFKHAIGCGMFLSCLWPAQPQIKPAFDTLDSHYRPL